MNSANSIPEMLLEQRLFFYLASQPSRTSILPFHRSLEGSVIFFGGGWWWGRDSPCLFERLGTRSICKATKEPHKCLRSSSSLISNTNQKPEDFANQTTSESSLFPHRAQRLVDFRVSLKVLIYKWEYSGSLVNLSP